VDVIGQRGWAIAEGWIPMTSEVPIVVQHTRPDNRQAENALLFAAG
jgi:hypothetical protein